MNRILLKYTVYFIALGLIVIESDALAEFSDIGRFFYMGDGRINISDEKNGESFVGPYRLDAATYDPKAIEAIYHVFHAPYDPTQDHLSLRLIEFLDYLEDHFNSGARISIVSGYRDPEYNKGLRNQGRLAAKASLHQYGMAVDFKMDGVPAKRIWEYVKGLGFGGTGYYHGETVHVDVGPARSWDEKTSGVGSGISSYNKLIGIVTDRDIYLPGEKMTLRFIRMTAFPIGVLPKFRLIRQALGGIAQKEVTFKPSFPISVDGPCPQFNNIHEMASIRRHLPADLPAGRYKVYAVFCNSQWEDMPPEIATPEFEIKNFGNQFPLTKAADINPH